MSKAPNDTIGVLFCCTGIGILNRGIESFFREAFDGLKDTPGLEARLIKGADKESKSGKPKTENRERLVWCLRRTGIAAQCIGKFTGRSAYAVEQWSSFFGVLRQIREFRPHVVFTSEANLMFLLRRFRRQIGVPFRVLYSNGGPVHPPFNRHDVVHQVAPLYRDKALAAGEAAGKHLLVPYGIRVPDEDLPTCEVKQEIRARLGLPQARPVILSVGWIAREHKRMHHLIEEIARLPEPRPYVQMLGATDEATRQIVVLAEKMLGRGNFGVASVPYGEVADYYRAADVFVLCSLAEGFGRVYLEALMHGLPTFGHSHPVIEYVLGDVGTAVDMGNPGALADALSSFDFTQPDLAMAAARRESVRRRFSWESLASQYLEMFRCAANQTNL